MFGIFAVSVLPNTVHLAFGVAGLAMARVTSAARLFLLGGGAIYLALWLYGVIVPQDSAANFVPLNVADNWLHLALGAGRAFVAVSGPAAWGSRLGRTSTATPRRYAMATVTVTVIVPSDPVTVDANDPIGVNNLTRVTDLIIINNLADVNNMININNLTNINNQIEVNELTDVNGQIDVNVPVGEPARRGRTCGAGAVLVLDGGRLAGVIR